MSKHLRTANRETCLSSVDLHSSGTPRRGTESMRSQVFSADAPAPLGPYSQAIVSGSLVFCSGTLGIDPTTGIAPESVAAQTEQALRNLARILSESGSSMQQLVKTTIYYVRAEDFAAQNSIFTRKHNRCQTYWESHTNESIYKLVDKAIRCAILLLG